MFQADHRIAGLVSCVPVERFKKLLELRNQYHVKMREMRSSTKTNELIDGLLELHAVTVSPGSA